MSTSGATSPPDEAIHVLLNEHQAMRGAIEAIWQREGALFSGFLLTAAGAATVVALTDGRTQVDVAFVAAIILGLAAWAVELQYWDILWFELYMVRILRPRVIALVDDATVPSDTILGFEQFKRERPNIPIGMVVLVALGSAFYQISLATTTLAFWITALVLKNNNDIGWSTETYALLIATVVIAVPLMFCVVWGYLIENLQIPSKVKAVRKRSK